MTNRPYKQKKKRQHQSESKKKTCGYCRRFFVPTRPDQRYCEHPLCNANREKTTEMAKRWLQNTEMRRAAEDFVRSQGGTKKL